MSTAASAGAAATSRTPYRVGEVVLIPQVPEESSDEVGGETEEHGEQEDVRDRVGHGVHVTGGPHQNPAVLKTLLLRDALRRCNPRETHRMRSDTRVFKTMVLLDSAVCKGLETKMLFVQNFLLVSRIREKLCKIDAVGFYCSQNIRRHFWKNLLSKHKTWKQNYLWFDFACT